MKDDLIKQTEKNVINEQKYRDGIPQLLVGVFLVITMLMMMNGRGNLFVIFIPMIPLLMEGLRKRITYPRVGYAQMKERGPRRQVLIWLVLAVLIAGAVVFMLSRGNSLTLVQSRQIHFFAMHAVALIVVGLSVVFLSRNPRTIFIWYALAIIIFVNAVLFFRLEKDAVYWILLGFGVLHIIYGAISLITFLRKYPVLKDEQ